MMNNLKERAIYALQGEEAGPSVEQIIGLAAALIIGSAIIAFANTAYKWVKDADERVDGISQGDKDLHEGVNERQ